jgi:hypothetical protein
VSLLVQIGVVVATVAAAVVAVAAIRAMVCVERAARELSTLSVQVREWVVQADAFTREARDAVSSVRAAAVPLGRVARRLEVLGGRSADLSAAVLGEVEPPVRLALDVARSVRLGIACLMERLTHRFDQGRTATRKGTHHE